MVDTGSLGPVKSFFLQALAQDNLNHAYIFAGPNGTGKVGVAKWLGQTIFCLNNNVGEEPCGNCNNCKRVADNDFPDVIRLKNDANSISVDEIRELVRDMARTAYEGFNKLFVIEEADKMTTSAQNSLLKFLEEPTPSTTIILSTSVPNKLLATIQSRCQQLDFLPQDENERFKQLVALGIPDDRAVILKSLTEDIEEARKLYEDESTRDLMQAVGRYYIDLRAKKDETFVYIQSNLTRLMSDRKTQQLALDILLANYRQGLKEAFQENHSEREGVEIAYETKVVLDGIRKFQSYVPIQSVLESITLTILSN